MAPQVAQVERSLEPLRTAASGAAGILIGGLLLPLAALLLLELRNRLAFLGEESRTSLLHLSLALSCVSSQTLLLPSFVPLLLAMPLELRNWLASSGTRPPPKCPIVAVL